MDNLYKTIKQLRDEHTRKHDRLEQDWIAFVDHTYHEQYLCYPFMTNLKYKLTDEDIVKNHLLELLENKNIQNITLTEEIEKMKPPRPVQHTERDEFEQRMHDVLSFSKQQLDAHK